jgi:putative DNA methylase
MIAAADSVQQQLRQARTAATALEADFPIVEVSQVAEQESWRKEINRPIYHIHKWWATRLGSVFRAITLAALSPPASDTWRDFYKAHSFKDKVVLDPFMGSGTTLGEAVKLGAKAIGCDINPVSSFLVRQAFTRVRESDLHDAVEQLERSVAPEIRRYYQTYDPNTGGVIPVLYYFWVKTLLTPTGESVPLLSSYVFAQDAYPKMKPRAQIVCADCWAVIEGRYDATEITCASCEHKFNPQIGPASGQYVSTPSGRRFRIKDLLPADGSRPSHRLYAVLAIDSAGTKVYLPAKENDFALYAKAEARLSSEDLPLPTTAVRQGHNTDQARGYNYTHWRDFFNARQLLCLGLLLKGILRIENETVRDQLICLFSSTLEFNNLFCSYKGEGTGAVRHMFSNHILKPERTPLENSVWGTERSSGTFRTLFESRLLSAKRYLDEPFELDVRGERYGRRPSSRKILSSAPIDLPVCTDWQDLSKSDKGVLILNGDSAHLPLPDGVVDAVITDPPYFDFVHYSELSDFFFAWLSPALRKRYAWFDRVDSSAVGEVQQKDPRLFAQQLGSVLAESRRVLRAEGVLAFSFHHSRADGWAAIYEALIKADLYVVAAHPVHGEMRAASPKSAAKSPISLDAILVCRKEPQAADGIYSVTEVLERAERFANRLEEAGMTISLGDRFVIGAAQALILSAVERLSFDQMRNRLEALRQQLLTTEADPI